MKPIRAIVPAAGKGKRLQKLGADVPKAMICVCNRPMLETVTENLSFIDNKNIYIVVGHGKQKIIDYFGDKFNYCEQKEQLGTGHAAMCCVDEFSGFDGNVLVTFGDMPLFRREEMQAMCLQHDKNNAQCTLMTAQNPELTMWARVERDDKGNFKGIVEGKDCTPEQSQIKELFSGVMVFDSKALFEMLPKVGCANAQKEYYLTEVPQLMKNAGMKVETYFIKDGNDLRGVNTPEDVEICEKLLCER